MKIVKPSVSIMTPIDGYEIMRRLEQCGRVCYKSEDRITFGSYERFLRSLIRNGHESVLEHYSFTVKFTVDRGVSHEIVRHRLASYSQESTRYCNYSKDSFEGHISVIEPCFLQEGTPTYETWKKACEDAERAYFKLLEDCSPQEARSVLPMSLKTELVMTANIREWRHFIKMRCSKAAHPQIREVAEMLLNMCYTEMPVLFEDLVAEIEGGKA